MDIKLLRYLAGFAAIGAFSATMLHAQEEDVIVLDEVDAESVPIEESILATTRPISSVYGTDRSILDTPRNVNIISREQLDAIGIKNVTFNENYFQGHFDSMSVMPGALIIESMAQSAGTLVMYSLQKNQENISVYLLTVDKAKFRKPVCPGDTLFHKVEKKQNVKNIWKFKCTSFVKDELVAEAEVSAIINSS